MHYNRIFESNRRWVAETTAADPEFFAKLAAEHHPQFLFIGCSDARVPANVITGTANGEMFVHRNVANLVVPTDTNLLAVLEFAVDVLQVREVFVCGHYGCGGVAAAMARRTGNMPQVDNWLSHIRGVMRLHAAELAALPNDELRYRRMVELNVAEQVHNLARTPVVQEAWARGQPLGVHGWVYELSDGLLRDLHVSLREVPPDVPVIAPQRAPGQRPAEDASSPAP
ncbi:MAG TPA: carbonic anhydrase [Gemmatimonadaceae bacterium]|nr:carbonic anhydrase [Gemmatimonadaceae bacterium]